MIDAPQAVLMSKPDALITGVVGPQKYAGDSDRSIEAEQAALIPLPLIQLSLQKLGKCTRLAAQQPPDMSGSQRATNMRCEK